MNYRFALTTIALVLLMGTGCKQTPAAPETKIVAAVTPAELSAMADAVAKTGPREGNNYKVFFLVLRQDTRPAVNFKVDMWVKGKGEMQSVRTGENGLAVFENLPFPDAKHPLEASLHYFKGANDQAREITYPFIESDAYRLKDSQYIPNTVTPDPA